jgi:hypothetical protein
VTLLTAWLTDMTKTDERDDRVVVLLTLVAEPVPTSSL